MHTGPNAAALLQALDGLVTKIVRGAPGTAFRTERDSIERILGDLVAHGIASSAAARRHFTRAGDALLVLDEHGRKQVPAQRRGNPSDSPPPARAKVRLSDHEPGHDDLTTCHDVQSDDDAARRETPTLATARPAEAVPDEWADRPADDLGWMFGADEHDVAVPEITDSAVARACDDLLGDWTRKGGELGRGEVSLLAAARDLSAAQVTELIGHLEAAGVELSDAASGPPRAEGSRTEAASTSRAPGGDLDLLGLYMDEISRYPLLTAQREMELWSLIVEGNAAQEEVGRRGSDLRAAEARQLVARVEAGRRAWVELVCCNLRLVVSIARQNRYEGKGVEFADRIQDGNLGLMRAADKFDGSKGYKFSTYATWWIQHFIERGIADMGRTIRIPVHMVEKMKKVLNLSRKLEGRFGREPTIEEIADKAMMESASVAALLDLARPLVSIDTLLGEEGELRLSDILTTDERDGRTDPANVVIEAVHRAVVGRTLVALLTEREREVIERRYGFDTGEKETLDAIGEDFGVTRERVRQIEGKAMKKLRGRREVRLLTGFYADGDLWPFPRTLEKGQA